MDWTYPIITAPTTNAKYFPQDLLRMPWKLPRCTAKFGSCDRQNSLPNSHSPSLHPQSPLNVL